MEWNGSYLGKIEEENIIDILETINGKCWLLQFNNIREVVFVRSAKTGLPCIVDEFKIHFGLNKIGSHLIKYRSEYYVIYKPKLEDKYTVETYFNLDQIDYTKSSEKLKKDIRINIALRELLTISPTYVTNFLVKDTDEIVCYSCSKTSDSSILSIKLRDYLNGYSISDILKEIFNIESDEDLYNQAFVLKSTIEDIINKLGYCGLEYIPDLIFDRFYQLVMLNDELSTSRTVEIRSLTV